LLIVIWLSFIFAAVSAATCAVAANLLFMTSAAVPMRRQPPTPEPIIIAVLAPFDYSCFYASANFVQLASLH
jgi:hypothetical protein